MADTYKVFVKTDAEERIIDINSSAFLFTYEDWIQIDEGFGDRYHHAQGNYFDKSITDDRGIYRYKLENGIAIERDKEEMEADYIEPEQKPSQLDVIEAQVTYTAMMTDTLLEV